MRLKLMFKMHWCIQAINTCGICGCFSTICYVYPHDITICWFTIGRLCCCNRPIRSLWLVFKSTEPKSAPRGGYNYLTRVTVVILWDWVGKHCESTTSDCDWFWLQLVETTNQPQVRSHWRTILIIKLFIFLWYLILCKSIE